ncbi:alpha/beta fold hydrolase [Kitasatospora sp. NPDC056531]|uniref:alpha/beta hydrolase family protein n=1 Tax=Kitasatospora sp. NPDC056531 TaxID=3345856 RepID=UPI0036B8CB77
MISIASRAGQSARNTVPALRPPAVLAVLAAVMLTNRRLPFGTYRVPSVDVMELHSVKGPMPTTALDRQLIAVKPITVPTTDRGVDLQVKVTAPADGRNLPVIVFSHGNAWSMDGYEPLVDRWTAAGFVVVQPTHLDSRRNGIGFKDPRFATIWRVRIADLHAVLDGLGDILDQFSGLSTRVDRERVAVVGHSWGAQTAGALLGARVFDAEGNPGEGFSHPVVKAGALVAATGTGDTLTPFALKYLPFARPDFSTMTTPPWSSPAERTSPPCPPADRTGSPTPTTSVLPRSDCLPSPRPSTSSAEFPARPSRTPPTRTPPVSSWSRTPSPPSCSMCSAPTEPAGRPCRTRSAPAPAP